jgi:Arc/MetJ family transcription regulator
MVSVAKKAGRSRRSGTTDRTVVYRGIKIAPMTGRRSAVAKAIRDALRTKSEQLRAKPAHI